MSTKPMSRVQPERDPKTGREFLQFELPERHLSRRAIKFYYPSAQDKPRDTRALVVHTSCLTMSAVIAIAVIVFQIGDLALAIFPMGGNVAEIVIDFIARLGD
jgi:hypothetical protein